MVTRMSHGQRSFAEAKAVVRVILWRNLLENCVLPDLEAGKNPKPLAAIAFHYDQFTSFSSTQHCELAYLCSAGIKVRILVSPSNFENMKKLYTNMPGLPESSQPKVIPFKLGEKHLNIENTMTLMNVKENDSTPLYLAVIWEILRRMAASPTPREGIDYKTFRNQIKRSTVPTRSDHDA